MSAAESRSTIVKIALFVPMPVLLWFGRHFLRWNRLEKIEPVPLGVPISAAIAIYGSPLESKPSDEIPSATMRTFLAGPFHEAIATELNGHVVQITYWSAHAAPIPDLRFMLEHYGQDLGWDEIEKGYWYWRKDGRIRLWCSAIPAIGVGNKDYFEARRAAKAVKNGHTPNV